MGNNLNAWSEALVGFNLFGLPLGLIIPLNTATGMLQKALMNG